MIKLGTDTINDFPLGSNEINRIYLGSSLIYEAVPAPPPYDAIVEYIQTNGSQYIDLGLKGNAATFGLYIDFQQTTAKVQARLIAANQTNAPCSMYINGSGKAGFRAGSAWGGVNTIDAFGTTRHTWFCDYYHQNNKIDDVDYAMASSYTGTTNSNLLLCGPYTNQNKFIGKIYAAKIYVSGTLKVDLVPCRVGTTAYMYDAVSNTLFENAGTGSYGYGSDV